MRNKVLEIQCSASSNSRPLLRQMRLWTARLRLNQPRNSDSVAGLIVFSRLLIRLWGLVTASASGHSSDVQWSSPPSTENVSVVHSASMDARAVQSFSYASRGVAA